MGPSVAILDANSGNGQSSLSPPGHKHRQQRVGPLKHRPKKALAALSTSCQSKPWASPGHQEECSPSTLTIAESVASSQKPDAEGPYV
jgi:hypothetical protein